MSNGGALRAGGTLRPTGSAWSECLATPFVPQGVPPVGKTSQFAEAALNPVPLSLSGAGSTLLLLRDELFAFFAAADFYFAGIFESADGIDDLLLRLLDSRKSDRP